MGTVEYSLRGPPRADGSWPGAREYQRPLLADAGDLTIHARCRVGKRRSGRSSTFQGELLCVRKSYYELF